MDPDRKRAPGIAPFHSRCCLKLKRIYRTFGKSSFGAVTNIRFGLTNIRWAKKKSVSAQIGNCETPRPSEPWRSTPANSVVTKETSAAQAGSCRSRIEYFAFNLAISFQSPLRLTLQRAFATKCANFVEEDLKIWSVCLESLSFLGATLASKSRRNFVTWDDRDRSFRHRAPQSCNSVAFFWGCKDGASRKKFWTQNGALGEVTCSASSAKFKKRIAGMLDVGKDIVSHFKHSDLSTDALLEQQREINPTMKPRKLIQTSWKDKH